MPPLVGSTPPEPADPAPGVPDVPDVPDAAAAAAATAAAAAAAADPSGLLSAGHTAVILRRMPRCKVWDYLIAGLAQTWEKTRGVRKVSTGNQEEEETGNMGTVVNRTQIQIPRFSSV